MTRLEKAARARELRDQGLLVREIVDVMGSPRSTVSSWLSDPDLAKHRRRLRGYAQPCPKCGQPMDGHSGLNGKRPSKLCGDCRRDEPHTVQAALVKAEIVRASVMTSRWPDAALLDALKFFAKVTGACTVPTYRDLAPDMGLPSSATIIQRFGSWNEAKRQAGLPVYRRNESRSYARMSDSELLDALRVAEGFIGQPPSYAVYEGIRGSTDLSLPCAGSIRNRFGGWANALAAAFGDRELEAA